MAKSKKATMSPTQRDLAIRVLKKEGLHVPRSAHKLEQAIADFAHFLRAKKMTREKIARYFQVSFSFVRWLFEKYPYAPDNEPVACICGCGKTFPPNNGRLYYNPKVCRRNYIERVGAVVEQLERPKKTSHRQTYCTQTIDYDQVTCARYMDSCGADCLRMENGKPCCFVRPSPRPRQGFSYQAVDYCGSTPMPGLRTFR